uniref:DUF659 domain-containing protein n=1 Tax=Timema douglasi TaxID=61478 RepID=A0A7R8ZAA4_TIMDO|nr:unnamed protein product [Timema douglasi]
MSLRVTKINDFDASLLLPPPIGTLRCVEIRRRMVAPKTSLTLTDRNTTQRNGARRIPPPQTILSQNQANTATVAPKTIEKIKESIGDSYFWASVDETTDRCGRYIANIVVGKLDSTGPSSPHLIASRVLEVANSSTIARVVRDSLRVLWPSENNDEKLMVLLTDSAAYILKAGASLMVFYAKLIHVTCLAHAVYRVIQTFDEEDAVSIREAKVATSSSSVVSDLAYVKSYFGNLPGVIVSL